MSSVTHNPSLDNLNGIFSWPREKLASEIHPDFQRYFSYHLQRGNVNGYYREMAEFVREGGLRGHVLDFACGFGLTSLCMRCLGVSKVTGADLMPAKYTTAQHLASLTDCDDVQFVKSDDDLQFADNSFDGILLKDALSHFTTDSPFLRHAYRVLRPGGTLLIVEDRNALCVGTVYQTRKIWERSENGGPEELKGLGLKRNYTDQRIDYLTEHFPEMGERQRREIAVKYRGYTNAQLGAWLKGGPLGRKGAPCVGPAGGAQERLINPFKLKRELTALGFRCKLRPRYRSDALKRIVVGTGWPLSLPLSGLFLMVAHKA